MLLELEESRVVDASARLITASPSSSSEPRVGFDLSDAELRKAIMNSHVSSVIKPSLQHSIRS
jgi:hypothetical protein